MFQFPNVKQIVRYFGEGEDFRIEIVAKKGGKGENASLTFGCRSSISVRTGNHAATKFSLDTQMLIGIDQLVICVDNVCDIVSFSSQFLYF